MKTKGLQYRSEGGSYFFGGRHRIDMNIGSICSSVHEMLRTCVENLQNVYLRPILAATVEAQ